LGFSACSAVSSTVDKGGGNSSSAAKNSPVGYDKPKIVGKITSGEITESSGIVASGCNEKVFWTHNDSGNGAFLFAINASGEKLGTWKVSGAQNKDWEDIATFKNSNGECFLYVGDIGNNERLKSEMTIYRVKEPMVSDANKSSSKKNPQTTEAAQAIKFNYPGARHDAETLLVQPQTGDIYVLSKSLSQSSAVYKLAANYDTKRINTLKKIADYTVPALPGGFLTGGDISPDGKRVVICDYFNGYEITLPKDAKNFDQIWTQKPDIVDLGAREQGEGVCYTADGNSIFATSEKKNSPLFEVKRR
jgi:hypothetical protein